MNTYKTIISILFISIILFFQGCGGGATTEVSPSNNTNKTSSNDNTTTNNETNTSNESNQSSSTIIEDTNETNTTTQENNQTNDINNTTQEPTIIIEHNNTSPVIHSIYDHNLLVNISNRFEINMEQNSSKLLEINASDIDNDTLEYNASSTSSNVTLSWNENNLTILPDESFTGEANITIEISDGNLTAKQTLFIYIGDKTLSYLNTIRTLAGLVPFAYNESLSNSSQNHASYILETNLVGHFETNSGATNYTGYSPTDRAGYVGYKGSISENLTTNTEYTDYISSIDQLMTAIYHRFGFLDMNYDEVGYGFKVESYSSHVYNMGTMKLNNQCSQTSFDGFGFYFTNVCVDTNFRIEDSVYNSIHDDLKDESEQIITWPYENQQNFQVAFYDESPDPLPSCDVSGNPISIEFNAQKNGTISMDTFKLYDENNIEITDTTILTQTTDPNDKLTDLQFVLFPNERLEFDSSYTARFNYTDDGTPKEKEWSFKTRKVGYPYYRATNANSSFNIQSNTSYIIYVTPNNCTDTLGALSWISDVADIDNDIDLSFIDGNTILIKVNGALNQYVEITSTKASKTIRLTISNSDSAIID